VEIDDAVRERLLAISPLATLVSDRVYQLVLKQGERNASVRMLIVDEDAPQHLRGPDGTNTTRFQTDAYVTVGTSTAPFAEVRAVASAIHGDGLGEDASGLFGFIGNVGGSPAHFRILNVRRALKRGPTYEHEGEFVRLRVMQDYWVTWQSIGQ
jgi:hypothetical protein